MTDNLEYREREAESRREENGKRMREGREKRPVRIVEARRKEPEEVLIVEEDRSWTLRQMLHKATRLIWLGSGTLQAMIGFRVLLKAVAANPNNAFAQFVYTLTALFVRPFQGLTITPAFNGVVLELHSIIAIFVYALLTWGLVEFIWILFGQYNTRRISS